MAISYCEERPWRVQVGGLVSCLYLLQLSTLRIKASRLSLASSLSSSSNLFRVYRESDYVGDSVKNILVLPISGS